MLGSADLRRERECDNPHMLPRYLDRDASECGGLAGHPQARENCVVELVMRRDARLTLIALPVCAAFILLFVLVQCAQKYW